MPALSSAGPEVGQLPTILFQCRDLLERHLLHDASILQLPELPLIALCVSLSVALLLVARRIRPLNLPGWLLGPVLGIAMLLWSTTHSLHICSDVFYVLYLNHASAVHSVGWLLAAGCWGVGAVLHRRGTLGTQLARLAAGSACFVGLASATQLQLIAYCADDLSLSLAFWTLRLLWLAGALCCAVGLWRTRPPRLALGMLAGLGLLGLWAVSVWDSGPYSLFGRPTSVEMPMERARFPAVRTPVAVIEVRFEP